MSVADPRYGGADPSPSQLSPYLRTGSDPDPLPDPPVGPFDSDKVDASDYAFRRAGSPDAPFMMLTYALTAWAASAGGQDRASHHPVLPLLMTAKVATDVVTNLSLVREEWGDNKALCAWCQTATLASVASLALAVPEAGRAWRRLRRR